MFMYYSTLQYVLDILSVVCNMCVPSEYVCALFLHICVYSVYKRVTYTHGCALFILIMV